MTHFLKVVEPICDLRPTVFKLETSLHLLEVFSINEEKASES